MRRSPRLADDVIRGVEAQHDGRHVVAGIAVGDIAAERADIAHLRVGDQQRGFAQDGKLGGEQVGADDLMLRRHRADDDVAAVGTDAFEVADAGEVDEMLRRRQAQLHHRYETVPAAERPRLLAKVGEQGHRLARGNWGDDIRRKEVSRHPPGAHIAGAVSVGLRCEKRPLRIS